MWLLRSLHVGHVTSQACSLNYGTEYLLNLQQYCQTHYHDKLYEELDRIFYDVVSTLENIHHLRIIHRDIKPGNILRSDCSPTARWKLTDFGAARQLNQDAQFMVISSQWHPLMPYSVALRNRRIPPSGYVPARGSPKSPGFWLGRYSWSLVARCYVLSRSYRPASVPTFQWTEEKSSDDGKNDQRKTARCDYGSTAALAYWWNSMGNRFAQDLQTCWTLSQVRLAADCQSDGRMLFWRILCTSRKHTRNEAGLCFWVCYFQTSSRWVFLVSKLYHL